MKDGRVRVDRRQEPADARVALERERALRAQEQAEDAAADSHRPAGEPSP